MKVKLRNPDKEVEISGGRKVRDVLGELGIDPDTVLVIRERELLTREDRVGEDDAIEVRPVISGGATGNRMKCRRCGGAAVVEIRRHNAAFCAECFLRHVRTQVERAVASHRMFGSEDRVLVAVSGGKDSLALWDLLLGLGYRADGLYLGLGIGDYSTRSGGVVRTFAAERDALLLEIELAEEYGFDVPTAGRSGSRSTCAVCGLSKRYVFNKAARDHGYDVVATGHNLDDEAATLLGNTLRWQTDYIARQSPVLPAEEGLARKVKPLYRLSELETAAYAFLRRIDYVVEECPLVAGNTHLRYKQAMNVLESTSPGTKAQFLLGYLERGAPLFAAQDAAQLRSCERCAQPTTGRYCAFCRARAQILGERLGEPRGGDEEGERLGEPRGGEGERLGARPAHGRELAEALSEEVLPVELYGVPGR
ncbi:MAG TPA: ATP-binding protein [Actinomycetota bacterium]|nr:ATP-binding protein [Actinomycetota bacterium]